MNVRTMLVALASTTLALLPMRSSDLPAQLLPVFGGSGGAAFSRSCGADRVLTGLRFRVGAAVDAIGLLCRPVNANGTLGSQTTVGSMAGGGGGTFGTIACPLNTVVRNGTVFYGSVVDGVRLTCTAWVPDSRSMGAFVRHETFGRTVANSMGQGFCEALTQPAIAVRGRAGLVVDALGFTCDEP
jgi:hypothetical protein